MNTILAEATVGGLVAEMPRRARVFEHWHIDYCCGGKKTLEKACQEKGLSVESITRELLDIPVNRGLSGELDLRTLPLGELADHIVATHHVYLKRELPRISNLIEKVVRAHSDRHPSLCELQSVFEEFRIELEVHMAKEERILFPMCKTLEDVAARPAFHCGSIKSPIWVMEMDHKAVGDALEQMRILTHGFKPPADACNTYRVMLDSIALLEDDIHEHVNKENNILFPRAIELEESLNGLPSKTALP